MCYWAPLNYVQEVRLEPKVFHPLPNVIYLSKPKQTVITALSQHKIENVT